MTLYKSGNACSSGDSAVQRCSIEPPWYFLLRHHSARPIHFFSYSFGHHCNHGINPRFQVRGASIFAVEADTCVLIRMHVPCSTYCFSSRINTLSPARPCAPACGISFAYHLRAQGDLPEGNECLSAEHICTNMYKMNCGCQTCYGKAV